MDGLTRLIDCAARWNHLDLSDRERCVLVAFRSLCAAHGRAHASHALAHAERLGDVIVGAGFERLDLFLFAIHRHIDVQQNHIERLCLHQVQRLFSARRLGCLESHLAQRSTQRTPDGWFVIDQQDADGRIGRGCSHGRAPPCGAVGRDA